MTLDAKEGPGQLQWGAGSWFGSQVGATAWLLLLGVLLLAQGRTAGAAILVVAVALNGLGVFLWRQRASREPHASIQLLIAASAVAALISVLLATPEAGSSPASSDPFRTIPSLLVLLVYPALMTLLYLQERAARRSNR